MLALAIPVETPFYFHSRGKSLWGRFLKSISSFLFFFRFFLYPTREKKREKEGAKDIKRHCDCCKNGYKNVKNIWNEIKSKSHTHAPHNLSRLSGNGGGSLHPTRQRVCVIRARVFEHGHDAKNQKDETTDHGDFLLGNLLR